VVEIKTPGEVEAMRAAGQVVAQILAAVQDQARAGMRTADLDEVAREVLAKAGAYSPFLNYQPGFAPAPFPAAICTSVNDAALHGIPGRYKLADGDLLSVDSGAVLDGWAADAAVSFTIASPPTSSVHGGPPPFTADARLIKVTRDALRAGIAAAVPGARIGDISAAIGAVGRAAGYGICTDFGGHGVGRAMHEDPHIPNEGTPGRGARLVPGLVIAIEPWFLAGGRDMYRIDRDGWTIRSGDGSRAAHAEHTVAVTGDGPRILTAPLTRRTHRPASRHGPLILHGPLTRRAGRRPT
jgi:methionyl aminopeptidase